MATLGASDTISYLQVTEFGDRVIADALKSWSIGQEYGLRGRGTYDETVRKEAGPEK